MWQRDALDTKVVTKIAYARVRAHNSGTKSQQKPTNMGNAFKIKNGINTKHINAFMMMVEYSRNICKYFGALAYLQLHSSLSLWLY
jgi:hypothetical protein